MMGEEAGWYRDPAPPNPTSPSTLRFWDGTQWTAQVKPAPKRQRLAWEAEDAELRRAYAVEQAELRAQQLISQVAHQQAGGVKVAAPTVVVEVSRDFTPDGERLAGWGRRFSAVLIDRIFLDILWIAFGWHFLSGMTHSYLGYVDHLVQLQRSGVALPPSEQMGTELISAIWPSLMGFLLVMLVVDFVYVVGFLKGFQATPGKLMLGMQVRRRDRPGPLSWGTVLMRWMFQAGYLILTLVPVLGFLASVYWLLDNLWPLWDGKRQALHDKTAGTNVVMLR
jgi:uncharacterized RDD family membrane protein YckC